jgi:serine protease Do
MEHFLRQGQSFTFAAATILVLGTGMALAPAAAHAQANSIAEMIQEPSPLLGHNSSSSQGYLGVDLADVDAAKAQELKLKDVKGAVITLIDHDAPAGQIGLKVNDVVVQLNGQPIEGAEQLRRMLKEIPPGRKVSLEISRDGNIQTLGVELADRRAMEHDIWNKIGNNGDVFAQPPALGILSGAGGDAPVGGGFHMPFFGSTLNVGAMVEPLTSQMAEYLGVPSGLMVKQVAHKSEAEVAGLKAFDVIVKVGTEPITNLAGWDRALRSNQGKPVQVTVLRDRKPQTLTLLVDSKHHGELEWEQVFPNEEGPMVALLDPSDFMTNSLTAEQLQQQAEVLRGQINGLVDSETNAQIAEQMRKQAEELKKGWQNFKVDPQAFDQMKQDMKNFKVDPNAFADMQQDMKNFQVDPKAFDQLKQEMQNFKIDPKAFDQLQQEMKDFKVDPKSFDLLNQNIENFKIDPKSFDELKRQMQDFQKNFKPEDFKVDPKQMEELKKQMEQMQKDMQNWSFANPDATV